MECSDIFFFFNDTATTEIYTLSLHDALPICPSSGRPSRPPSGGRTRAAGELVHRPGPDRRGLAGAAGHRADRSLHAGRDRKSTRLNSSHANISYAVFCLKKKKQILKALRITQ